MKKDENGMMTELQGGLIIALVAILVPLMFTAMDHFDLFKLQEPNNEQSTHVDSSNSIHH